MLSWANLEFTVADDGLMFPTTPLGDEIMLSEDPPPPARVPANLLTNAEGVGDGVEARDEGVGTEEARGGARSWNSELRGKGLGGMKAG